MKDYQSENINALSLFSVSFPEEIEVQITWVIPVRLMQKFESFGLISGFTYCWKVSSCNKRTRHSAAARYVARKAPSLACQQLKGNSGYLSCWRQKRVVHLPSQYEPPDCPSWDSQWDGWLAFQQEHVLPLRQSAPKSRDVDRRGEKDQLQ